MYLFVKYSITFFVRQWQKELEAVPGLGFLISAKAASGVNDLWIEEGGTDSQITFIIKSDLSWETYYKTIISVFLLIPFMFFPHHFVCIFLTFLSLFFLFTVVKIYLFSWSSPRQFILWHSNLDIRKHLPKLIFGSTEEFKETKSAFNGLSDADFSLWLYYSLSIFSVVSLQRLDR